jgi:hypothetical protein
MNSITMPIRSSLRSRDIPTCGGAGSTGGLPLKLAAAGLRKSEINDPNHPPDGLRGLRPALIGLAARFAVVRPGGLPRLTEPRLEYASRLVLAKRRSLFFPPLLRDWLLTVLVILGIIAQRVLNHPQGHFSEK